jgi:hypothetical protein
VTHNELVLQLLSDGEPHTHLELYDLRVIAHSRVAALRKQGHVIECWRDAGLHWYRLVLLNDGRPAALPPSAPPAPVVEEESGQYAMELWAA